MDDAAQLEIYSGYDWPPMQIDEAWHDMVKNDLSRRPAKQLHSEPC